METCTQCTQCEQLKQDMMDLLVLCERLREMLEEAENKTDELSKVDVQFHCPNCGYEWGCVLGLPGREFWHCLKCHVRTPCFIQAKGDKAHEACVEMV